MRPWREVEQVAELTARGLNDAQISRVTGVPRRTIWDWRRDARRPPNSYDRDPDVDALPQREYAYLLGVYLGDGCVSASHRGVWRLRIVLDAAYPGIIEESRRALVTLRPLNRAGVYRPA